MRSQEMIGLYKRHEYYEKILNLLSGDQVVKIQLEGLVGSSRSLLACSTFSDLENLQVIIMPDKESAAYFMNDLESVLGEKGETYEKKIVLFFPSSYKRHYEGEGQDKTNMLSRSEVINRLGTTRKRTIVVTYPEALGEMVVTRQHLAKSLLKLRIGDIIGLDLLAEELYDLEFERVDFVYEPGQFSIRGGIADVFSYSNDHPFRIEFEGDKIASLRTFDPMSQLSVASLTSITILPDLHDRIARENSSSFIEFLPGGAILWFDNIFFTADRIEDEYLRALAQSDKELPEPEKSTSPKLYIRGNDFLRSLGELRIVEFGRQFYFDDPGGLFKFECKPQPSFNKNFDLLITELEENSKTDVENYILSDNPKQLERLYSIFDDIHHTRGHYRKFDFIPVNVSLHEGFIDLGLKAACYTDHQIFDRYHRFFLKEKFNANKALTIKELYNLNPGDYVTHIDHGIGRFDGLEKIENNGRIQEAIRIVYRDNDLLYVSIHSLHRLAKYVGKEGTVPSMDKLGSNAWNRLKTKTKSKVKDIAKELIKLYAERKKSSGFSFTPDTYLQNELEASFIYEDTPDQLKSTNDVKRDMEAEFPMDRLVCGDVGFGKTEVAIRAAFKAVTDSKQVAVLVPTTILALQHYKTFSSRLKEFPCTIDYINRFKSAKNQKETLKALEQGSIDILIGTHRLLSQDIKFKDLGLLIVDEEQKFGVGAKEKLKHLKVNVDTLTLTATPIPRTLQFSLMGARDLSVINTPPANRHPVQTEIRPFTQSVIHDAVMYEVSRGGQVFFVHNRIQNIYEIREMIHRFLPGITIAVAHGQMEGHKLEEVMIDFIEGEYDVLLSTTIIESGLDIPNVNTIIINDAHNYGLSDLHQLRGRVGRANRQAFCYLLSPPLSSLTNEARKRLRAIEEFSDLGSGFNISLRDLDIRGAGNILGAEQSGFITDIGFEMYQKILDEAIQELKQSEFRELFNETRNEEWVSDCQVESDLEILIPDDYVTNVTERLALYKEMDSLANEEFLQKFRVKLIDRFGPVPKETEELFETIRLRWSARRLGFEKIILRNDRFSGYFVSNPESPFYQSATFVRILEFIKENHRICSMKEVNNKLSLTIKGVRSVRQAHQLILPIIENEL